MPLMNELAGSDVICRAARMKYFVFLLIFWLLAAVFPFTFAAPLSLANIFAYAVIMAFLCVVGLFAVQMFFVGKYQTVYGWASLRMLAKLVVFSLAGGVFLEGMTLFGAPSSSVLSLGDWGIKRLLFFVVCCFSAGILFLRFGNKTLDQFVLDAIEHVRKQNWQKVAGVSAAILGVSGAMALVIHLVLHIAFFPAFLFCIAIVLSLSAIFFIDVLRGYPERCFLVLALSFGLFTCTQIPAMTGISWDDQIHFKNALQLSYVFAPELTDSDINMADMAVYRALGEETAVGLGAWNEAEVSSYNNRISAEYQEDIRAGRVHEEFDPTRILTFNSIGYAPSAIGLWLARALHLPFFAIVMAGRIANLFSYCLVCYAAIRVAPAKKYLFAAIGLIPTNIFMAANYSYDPWLVSFLMLGTALLLREMWANGDHLSYKRLALPSVILFLGLCVKAIYFPIIGLYFLMPRDKFTSSWQRARYYGFVVAFGLFVFATFAVPFLFGVSSGAEASAGDMRGGSGVSSPGQLAFILHNPLQYASIIGSFLISYLHPFGSAAYLFGYAYLDGTSISSFFGIPVEALNVIPVILFILVAAFDGSDTFAKRAGLGTFLWTLFLFIVSFVLVATSMYVSFTPVGYGTVNGCQPRYLLPWLAPLLAFACNAPFSKTWNAWIRRGCFLVVSLPLAACTYLFVLSHYVLM